LFYNKKYIFIAISFFLFIFVSFGVGSYLNRPLDMSDKFADKFDSKLRVLVYSDTPEFNPIPFWEALKKADDKGVLKLDFIPRKTADADVVVYFLTSWDNYKKMPERNFYEGGFSELATVDNSIFYKDYRSRIKQFNRDIHLIVFNRNVADGIKIPPECFANAVLQSVRDWSVYYEHKGCL